MLVSSLSIISSQQLNSGRGSGNGGPGGLPENHRESVLSLPEPGQSGAAAGRVAVVSAESRRGSRCLSRSVVSASNTNISGAKVDKSGHRHCLETLLGA